MKRASRLLWVHMRSTVLSALLSDPESCVTYSRSESKSWFLMLVPMSVDLTFERDDESCRCSLSRVRDEENIPSTVRPAQRLHKEFFFWSESCARALVVFDGGAKPAPRCLSFSPLLLLNV